MSQHQTRHFKTAKAEIDNILEHRFIYYRWIYCSRIGDATVADNIYENLQRTFTGLSDVQQSPCAVRPLNHQFGKYKIHNRNIEIKHIFLQDQICLLHNETQLILTKSIPFLNNKILLQSALHT